MTATHQPELPVGTVLEGKFRITREVGRGGMAVVYEAVHVDIGKRVAVKLLSQDLVASRVVRERFLREARAAAAIRSPHICEVYDSGMYEERPFLVMELLEGESLYERLTRVRRLDPATTLEVIEQTARGLSKAHQVGVIHRDLKPENIFLTQDEDGRLLSKLVDFGLAKFYESNADGENVRLTREGALFGTPAYMSPEQAKGHGGVDHRADLWALGCIVYECLTGKTVWNVEQGVAMILAQIAAAPLPKPSMLFADLPPGFDDWFARALSRLPEERFQTPRELADSLRSALTTGSAPAELVSDTDLAPPVAPIPSAPPLKLAPAILLTPPPPHGSSVPLSTPAPRRGSWAMGLALGALGVALAGYVAWLVLHQGPAEEAGNRAEPLEREPYALKVNAAQLSLMDGDPDKALQQFEEGVALGQAPVARSLLQRCEIIVEQRQNASNRCRVTGLGRPRPFDVLKPASRPSVVLTANGPLLAWADNHLAADKRQVSATFLDNALRRVSPAYALSPESVAVADPTLINLGAHIAAVYSDTGEDAGLLVRAFTPATLALAAPTRLSTPKRTPFSPAVAIAPEGDLWFVWEESNTDGSASLLVRQTTAALVPTAPAIRVLTLAPRFRPGVTRGSSKPSLAVSRTQLRIVFAQELTPARSQIKALIIERGDRQLRAGVAAETPRGGPEAKPTDLHLGQLLAVSDSDAKNVQPQLNCSAGGDCFVAWDTGTDNASLAYLTASGALGWRRSLAASGSRPVIAHNASDRVVVWFEEARLKLARLSQEGVGPASILTRVTGFQPHPSVVAGEGSGVWYVAWRDFEAGHLEAFVLRTECQ